MDEAHDLGFGKIFNKNGFIDKNKRAEIMIKHLNKVLEIAKKYGFKCKMWSDMFFRIANNGAYYFGENMPKEVIDKYPKEVALVYWDYYHLQEEFYDKMITAHRAFDRELAVASGLWTWARLSYDHGQTVERAEPCILSARRNRIKDFFFTMWGDDGAYCGFDTALAGIIWGADTAWGAGKRSAEELEKITAAWHAGSFKAVLTASEMNYQSPRRDNGVGCCSIWLWDDPVMGIGWRHLELDDGEIYRGFEAALTASAEQKIFPYAAAVSEFLLAKLHLRHNLLAAYAEKDAAALTAVMDNDIPLAVGSCRKLADEFRRQWVKNYKYSGMECCQHRFAGNIIRLEELACRIREFISGEAGSIPELEITADRRCSPVQEWHRDFAFSGVN
jgi:hypothetical protein